MPQLAPIVLQDGASTPANHTFAPRDIVGGISTLVESTGVPVGDRRCSIGLTTTSTGRQKVTVKITVPVVQDVVTNGVTRPTIVRAAYADLTLSFDGTSNTQERKDMVAYVKSLMGNALFASVAQDLAALY